MRYNRTVAGLVRAVILGLVGGMLVEHAPAEQKAESRGFRFVGGEFLPMGEIRLVLVPMQEGEKRLQWSTSLGSAISFPVTSGRRWDFWWVPQVGIPVRFAENQPLPQQEEIREVRLDAFLGVVQLRGDNLPRAKAVVLAPYGDPGPGEKGHQPIQRVDDYRIDLVVPAGFYSVWIEPFNGARSQRVFDKIRVEAGKITKLD